MGPAVRSAAADAARQVIELAAQRFEREERLLSLKGGQIVSSDGGSWPLAEITGLLDDGQILGKGARGPNPTGMRVLTFGIQLAEVAVDVGTGEVVVEKVVAIHDVGRVINPLGARSQIEGGIIQALGHTFSEVRLDDPQTGTILTRTLDSYKLPTIADVPEIVCDLVDEPDAAPDEPRLEGARRAADRPDRSRDRERDPRRHRRGRHVAADHPRGDPARAPRSRSREEGARCSWSGLARARKPWRHSQDGGRALAGGTELVPLLREGLVTAERLVDVSGVLPRGISDGTIGAGTTLAELEADPQIPAALREACRLAASPQLRNMGTIGGNLLQATRCWYWRLDFPCYLHGGDRCHAKAGQHREHAFFGNERCASAHPSDPAAALLALGATIRTDRRELDRRAVSAADRRRPRDDDARAGRADPRARRARGRVERLPEGDGPEAVGVRARRGRGGPRRRARRGSRSRARRPSPPIAELYRCRPRTTARRRRSSRAS